MLERVYAVLNADVVRQLTLLLLRVSVGMLSIWWGLAKIRMEGFGSTISDTFYDGTFSYAWLQTGFGGLQVLLGALVILGLFREIAYLAQLAVHGFTTGAVWYAIVDPFGWWLELERPFPHSQLFYPSAIVVAACLLLIAFRDREALALDRLVRRRRGTAPQRAAADPEDASAPAPGAAGTGTVERGSAEPRSTASRDSAGEDN
jgi:uncharacterized membrane protein YphA (DoxX/SURF4 family)